MKSKSTRQLGEVSEIYSGYAFRSGDMTKSGIPVLKIANIQEKRVLEDCKDHLPERLFEKKLGKYVLLKSDTLVAMTGAGSVGKFGKMPKIKGTFLVNQRVGIIRPNPELADPGYLYYVLIQDRYEEQLYSLGLGAGQPNVSAKQIGGLEIFLPDLPTQRKIAGILSAYDDLIENNLRRIKILEEMAQSLYREWLVHFCFPGHESVKFVDSPLGQIPKGWEAQPVGYFGKVITGKTPSKANADFFGEDVPFVKTPDMHGNMFLIDVSEKLSREGAESQANKTLPIGSICVSCIGTIGVVCITTEECQTNQQINSIALSDSKYVEFLYFRLLDAKRTLENLCSNGATMGNVNKSKFESMEVVCPSIGLIDRFHDVVSPFFAAILVLTRRNKNLRQTRDLMLPQLLTTP